MLLSSTCQNDQQWIFSCSEYIMLFAAAALGEVSGDSTAAVASAVPTPAKVAKTTSLGRA
jgi:hypothetical protein